MGKTIKDLEAEWNSEVEKISRLQEAIEDAKKNIEKLTKGNENVEIYNKT